MFIHFAWNFSTCEWLSTFSLIQLNQYDKMRIMSWGHFNEQANQQ
jgi:hypothetical protein